MKFWFVGFIIIISFLCFRAEAKERQAINVNDVIAKLKTELNLTDQQEQAIRPIIKETLLKHQELLQSLEEGTVINKMDLRTALRKLRKEENFKLSKVFSSEQMSKLLAKQNLRDGLNKDNVDFSEGLSSPTALSPQGGEFQF